MSKKGATTTEIKPLSVVELLVTLAVIIMLGLAIAQLCQREEGDVVRDGLITVVVTDNPRRLEIAPGERICLKASSSSEDGKYHKYQWEKDGTPISGATASILEIKRVTKNDAGEYLCVRKRGEK